MICINLFVLAVAIFVAAIGPSAAYRQNKLSSLPSSTSKGIITKKYNNILKTIKNYWFVYTHRVTGPPQLHFIFTTFQEESICSSFPGHSTSRPLSTVNEKAGNHGGHVKYDKHGAGFRIGSYAIKELEPTTVFSSFKCNKLGELYKEILTTDNYRQNNKESHSLILLH